VYIPSMLLFIIYVHLLVQINNKHNLLAQRDGIRKGSIILLVCNCIYVHVNTTKYWMTTQLI